MIPKKLLFGVLVLISAISQSSVDEERIKEEVRNIIRKIKEIKPSENETFVASIAILATSVNYPNYFSVADLINESIYIFHLSGVISQKDINDAYANLNYTIHNDTDLKNNADVFAYYNSAISQAQQILLNNFNDLSSLNVPAPSPVPAPTSSPKHHRHIQTPPSPVPARRIKTPGGDDFREKVQEVGMGIARNIYRSGRFVVTGHDIIDFFMNPNNSFSNIVTDQNMAYLMGYVQNCIYQLQKSSGNSAQMIVNLAEVLKALNQKVARA